LSSSFLVWATVRPVELRFQPLKLPDRRGMQAATRSCWKALPLPAQQDRIDLALLYSDAEGREDQAWARPQDMDDKWFMFFEKGWLDFHRSWTARVAKKVRPNHVAFPSQQRLFAN
jgi:hypothetical protein